MNEGTKAMIAGQDVTVIIEMNRRINHDDIVEVTREYEQIMEKDMLQSSVGNEYVKKLSRIMRREGKGHCLYCDAQCAPGKVLCMGCYRQNSTKEATNETLALVEEIERNVVQKQNSTAPMTQIPLSNVQMMPQRNFTSGQTITPEKKIISENTIVPVTTTPKPQFSLENAPYQITQPVQQHSYTTESVAISPDPNYLQPIREPRKNYYGDNPYIHRSFGEQLLGIKDTFWGKILIAVLIIAIIAGAYYGIRAIQKNSFDEEAMMSATADFAVEDILEADYLERFCLIMARTYKEMYGTTCEVSYNLNSTYGDINLYELNMDGMNCRCGLFIICNESGYVEGVWNTGSVGNSRVRAASVALLMQADPSLTADQATVKLDFQSGDEYRPSVISDTYAYTNMAYRNSAGLFIARKDRYSDVRSHIVTALN